MENEKLVGELLWWNKRRFGVIGVRNGAKIERFFLNWVQVDFCEPAEPHAGCIVRFERNLKAPKSPEHFYGANHAEIFTPQSVEEVLKAVVAESEKPQEGAN